MIKNTLKIIYNAQTNLEPTGMISIRSNSSSKQQTATAVKYIALYFVPQYIKIANDTLYAIKNMHTLYNFLCYPWKIACFTSSCMQNNLDFPFSTSLAFFSIYFFYIIVVFFYYLFHSTQYQNYVEIKYYVLFFIHENKLYRLKKKIN